MIKVIEFHPPLSHVGSASPHILHHRPAFNIVRPSIPTTHPLRYMRTCRSPCPRRTCWSSPRRRTRTLVRLLLEQRPGVGPHGLFWQDHSRLSIGGIASLSFKVGGVRYRIDTLDINPERHASTKVLRAAVGVYVTVDALPHAAMRNTVNVVAMRQSVNDLIDDLINPPSSTRREPHAVDRQYS